MKLVDLEPSFVKRTPGGWQRDVPIADADGLLFLCPKCFRANNGNVGTHSVLCWQPHVPQTVQPTPGRWRMQGSGFEDLTLVAGSSSVQLLGGCAAHFLVQNGQILLP